MSGCSYCDNSLSRTCHYECKCLCTHGCREKTSPRQAAHLRPPRYCSAGDPYPTTIGQTRHRRQVEDTHQSTSHRPGAGSSSRSSCPGVTATSSTGAFSKAEVRRVPGRSSGMARPWSCSPSLFPASRRGCRLGRPGEPWVSFLETILSCSPCFTGRALVCVVELRSCTIVNARLLCT